MQERRDFLKRTGQVLLGVATTVAMTSGTGKAGTAKRNESSYAMIIDVNRCTGCHSCVISCKEQNHTPQSYFNTRIETENRGSFPSAWLSYTPELCHQCEDAPCIAACESGASFKLRTGVVVIDWSTCNGDGACVEACPYEARFLDTDNGNKADKCDFCVARLEKGLEPACVDSCPSNARIFGDLANPQGEFGVYLAKMKEMSPSILQERKERLFFINAQKQ